MTADVLAPAAALELPWAGRADGHCFGCSPANPAGLGLRFVPDGDGISASFCLDRRYESYPGVLHGGIVALICDEVMGNLVVLRAGRPAVTTSMRTRYVGVIEIGGHYSCHATIDGADPVSGRAEIRGADGAVLATATASYLPLPADGAGLPITPREDPS